MNLRISRELADQMVQHCRDGVPNEACGLLASHQGQIVKVFRMSNAAASPVRYALDAKEQFAAYRTIEDRGWDLGGVFHSHTRTEAEPSPTDIRLAHEDVPYVIVSLSSDPPDIRAWRIVKESWDAEEGKVTEVPVDVAG